MTELISAQVWSVLIIVLMLAAFLWDRWRYDVVAMTALVASVLVGTVPQADAFEGFSDQVIVVIAAVLVVSKAVSKSGLLDRVVRRLMKSVQSPSLQIGALSAAVALLSAFVKNVGALGILMPIAIQTARRSKQSPSIYLMPLAFASLIGGTITQIGTSPNLLISTVREDLGGEPFRLFDYAWVGLPLTLLAVLYLSVGWRLLPKDRKGAASAEEQFSIEDYTTDMRVPDDSPFAGKSVGDLEKAGDDVVVIAVTREGHHNYVPSTNWPLYAGDVIVVQGEPAALKMLAEEAGLELAQVRNLEGAAGEQDHLRTIETIVTAESELVGRSPRDMALRRSYDVNVLAVSRAGRRRMTGLQAHTFEVGDVVVLQGWDSSLQATLSELGLLPLADRELTFGSTSQGLVSLAILAVFLVLISMKVVTVAVGFFAAAVLVILTRQVSLKQAYEAIEGPVIVLLACMIPIAKSLQTTGVTDIMGRSIAELASGMPGSFAIALMMATAMVVTPFVNNAAAVLMLGPVGGIVAKSLGYSPDPFLMAVALGCACDFLTPIGHQNNLLVMGPGGYRFTDYWRLGMPLSILVLAVGTPLIMFFWPLS